MSPWIYIPLIMLPAAAMCWIIVVVVARHAPPDPQEQPAELEDLINPADNDGFSMGRNC